MDIEVHPSSGVSSWEDCCSPWKWYAVISTTFMSFSDLIVEVLGYPDAVALLSCTQWEVRFLYRTTLFSGLFMDGCTLLTS